MGRSKHTLYDEHSKILENTALNPKDLFRTEQMTQDRKHGHSRYHKKTAPYDPKCRRTTRTRTG